MAVKARLEGHAFDLDTLARLFQSGDPAVGRDGEGYYLTSPSLDNVFRDGGGLNNKASSLLRKANGTARALDPSFHPVRLLGQFSDGSNSHHVVVVAETAHARAHVYAPAVVVDGAVAEPASAGLKYAQIAKGHPDAADALDILGKDVVDLTWYDLYKVYEIVRDNVGGKAAVTATNWVSANELYGFLNSSCTASISGDEARHARGTPQTSDTMTIQEGRSMISKLALRWLDSL